MKVFDNLSDLEKWKNDMAKGSRTKYIFPFCWRWSSRKKPNAFDIKIESFKRTWNPADPDDQVIWLNDPSDDRVACIYTSQGLDMDNVAFVWWDDLVWDERTLKWVGNVENLKDPAFKCRRNPKTQLWMQTKWNWHTSNYEIVEGGFELSQEDIELFIKNTYYVMLSRPLKTVAIWFKNEATKKHVLEVLGLKSQ